MDQKDNAEILKQDKKNEVVGTVHLFFFFSLIIAGIIVKRVYGHPEFMMLFHGPAAVFLIVGGLKITAKHRRKMKGFKFEQFQSKL